jgi:hypothetical protein
MEVALANRPVSAWLATRNGELLGFACYGATARGFFGPIGVSEAARGQHLGAALLLACLRDMRTVSYGYAIVGGAGASDRSARQAKLAPMLTPTAMTAKDTSTRKATMRATLPRTGAGTEIPRVSWRTGVV